MAKTINPTCPHCKYEFDSDETWHSTYAKTGHVHVGEDEDSDLVCPNLDCEKPFKVVCVHDVRFVAIDENGEEI